MEMTTCQDLAKILQKIIDIFHPIEMMPCQDLADHGQLGRPYEIVVNEVVGRHLVAVRDVKAGEVGNNNMSNWELIHHRSFDFD